MDARSAEGFARAIDRVKAVVAWATATRLGRTWQRYSVARGPLLAQGLSYQSIFATFAALWVAFSIAGLWLSADSPLQHSIVETIANAVPGLIDLGDGRGGAINVGALLSARVFGWTGAIAAVGLLWTAIGWFGAARSAVRALLGEPERPGNPLLLKLSDLGLAVGFGVAVLVSAALSLGSTSLLDTVLGWLGADESSGLAVLASRGAGLVVTLAFDFGVLVGLYRVLAPSVPPRRALLGGALLTAVGLGMLKALGGALLGGASSNPLLTSFAVFVGLLVWFNLVCQVILLGAAWIAEARSPARQQMPLPDVGGPA